RGGRDGASMIFNSASAVLMFGGCKDASDLDQFAKLTGEREEIVHTRDPDGRITSSTTRRVPVIPPAMLAGLKNHPALLIRPGMPRAPVRTPIRWQPRDVPRPPAHARAPTTRARGRVVAVRAGGRQNGGAGSAPPHRAPP